MRLKTAYASGIGSSVCTYAFQIFICLSFETFDLFIFFNSFSENILKRTSTDI